MMELNASKFPSKFCLTFANDTLVASGVTPTKEMCVSGTDASVPSSKQEFTNTSGGLEGKGKYLKAVSVC